jgi:aspartate aminotransferase
MLITSERLKRIKTSPDETASGRARKLLNAGVKIYALATGEPNFRTPDHVCDAVIRAMEQGKTKYTGSGGTPEMKAAIIQKFARENDLLFTEREVVAGAGAKSVINTAFAATLGPGDEVIISAPHWFSYTDMVLLSEGTPVIVTAGENVGFKLLPEALEAAITPRTRWVLLNSPNNPSGAIYTADELEALAAVLRRHPEIWIMADDIYEHIIFDGRSFATIAAVAPDLACRTLTVNGVSKAYAMTGWRIGYAGGPADLIAAMIKMQSQAMGSLCSISQEAAIAALTGPQDLVPIRSRSYQDRRDRVMQILAEVPGLRCYKPEGAFYLWVNCAGLMGKTAPDGTVIKTDVDLADYFLNKARTAVVHGRNYGISPYFRISLATAMEDLEAACAEMAASIALLH